MAILRLTEKQITCVKLRECTLFGPNTRPCKVYPCGISNTLFLENDEEIRALILDILVIEKDCLVDFKNKPL